MDRLEEVFISLPGDQEPAAEFAAPMVTGAGRPAAAKSYPSYAGLPARKRPSVAVMVSAAAVLLAIVAGVIFLTHRQSNPQAGAQPLTVEPLQVTPSRPSQFPPVQEETPVRPARLERPAGKAPVKVQQVQFVTTPPDAQVTVDSKRESGCKSPCAMELTEGPHTLLLQKDGFRTVLQDFTASPSQPEVAIPLTELTGSLLVQTDPPGAAIALNGKPRPEMTPANLTLAPGKYKVTVTKAGVRAYGLRSGGGDRRGPGSFRGPGKIAIADFGNINSTRLSLGSRTGPAGERNRSFSLVRFRSRRSRLNLFRCGI